jgi:hypothetical protein
MKQTTLATIFAVSAVWAQTVNVKNFFEQLPAAKTMPSYDQLLQATDQIATLSKAEVQELLPVLFADIKDDQTVGMYASLALFSVSRRPDSGELLRPRLREIAALYERSDPRFKATADQLLTNMKPQPPEAAGMLLSFIAGQGGTPQEKVDALMAAGNLSQPPPASQFETAALQILGMPLDPHTLAAALIASARRGASDKLIDALAQQLTNPNADVRTAAIRAVARLGAAAVRRHANTLAKLAGDASQPPPVRRLAQNALDGKDEPCVTLQGEPMKGCK